MADELTWYAMYSGSKCFDMHIPTFDALMGFRITFCIFMSEITAVDGVTMLY